MKTILTTGAALLSLVAFAAPAAAQSDVDGGSWTGGYIGGRVGYAFQPGDNGERVRFDTNGDNVYNNNVITAAGANAFSTGFCGGLYTSSAPGNCKKDEDDIDYYVFLGYDKQFGSNIVVGAVIEGGNANINDSVSAFSTTPAGYSMSRGLRGQGSVRLRGGYAFSDTLIYGTGGLAFARIRSRFGTTNTTNSFTNRDGSNALQVAEKSNELGYVFGGGIEHKFGGRFSVGIQYLQTVISDNDYRVFVGRGTSAATNPFVNTFTSGQTVFKRSYRDFAWHSVGVTAAYRF